MRGGVATVEGGEAEVALLLGESVADDGLLQTVDLISLLAHQHIDGFELALGDSLQYLLIG